MKYWDTSDGVEITPGLRVFTNDWKWGTVVPEQWRERGAYSVHSVTFDGWFQVRHDDSPLRDGFGWAYGTIMLNGDRMATVSPPGAPKDPQGS